MTSASTKTAIPALEQIFDNAWSKNNPLNPEEVLLRPVAITNLPSPQADAPLFHPADARRLWYTGFTRPWDEFPNEILRFWSSDIIRNACDAIADHPMIPARITEREREMAQNGKGASTLHVAFQREVLDVMQKLFIRLSDAGIFPKGAPDEIFLGNVTDEDLGNVKQKWEPSYVVKAAKNAENESLRVLGQVEYLGGRPGALTTAVKDRRRNTWGSLRCVLGNIAQSMLISSTRYAFLLSADEIMFLRFDLVEKCEYNTPDGEPVDLFVEPWLSYSQPIKFSATFDKDEGTVPLRVALLYLYSCAMQEDWEVQGEIGNSLKYFAETKAGEKYVPKFAWIKK